MPIISHDPAVIGPEYDVIGTEYDQTIVDSLNVGGPPVASDSCVIHGEDVLANAIQDASHHLVAQLRQKVGEFTDDLVNRIIENYGNASEDELDEITSGVEHFIADTLLHLDTNELIPGDEDSWTDDEDVRYCELRLQMDVAATSNLDLNEIANELQAYVLSMPFDIREDSLVIEFNDDAYENGQVEVELRVGQDPRDM